ncbi:MAG: tRNA epoxyqueuosine(34) reductase QueG [Bacteroidota bacterium]
MSQSLHVAQKIKLFAKELGFSFCGIARARKLDEDARRLENWLNQNRHGGMQYMEGHFDLRVDPTLLVPGAKSVITLMMNYFTTETQRADAPRISKYAWGQDYHEVIRAKLKAMLARMQGEIGEVAGRGFVDSAPVLERAWALQSGLGWIGKNGNLINKQQGSFFFIATLITDLEVEPDIAFAGDYCGSCTRCIEACPTEAILPNKVVDGSKCISYYTIELKSMGLSENEQPALNNWMFGCDVCQDVCPWNRFSKPHSHPEFSPLPEVLNFTTSDWEELTEEAFKKIFKDSPIKRSKFAGIKRNLTWVKNENLT